MLRGLSLLNSIFHSSVCLLFQEVTVADERVKEKEGEIKLGGCITTCTSICYTKLTVKCDWRRHLSKAVKLPMNYTVLTPSSLPLYILPSLFVFLFLPLGLSAWLPLIFSFFPPHCHMYLCQSTISNMGCAGRGIKRICHCFYLLMYLIYSCYMLLYLSLCP